jgi:hypothetical protein
MWGLGLGYWVGYGVLLEVWFLVGICYCCKPFRKSEVVFGDGISENRNSGGFGLGFDDWDLGCGKGLWISG